MIDLTYFSFLNDGNAKSVLEMVNELIDEGAIPFKLVDRFEGESAHDHEMRVQADLQETATVALSKGASAFREATAISVLAIVKQGGYLETTEAKQIEAEGEDPLELFLGKVSRAFSAPTVSRIRTFLRLTLPALEASGVEVTPAHIMAIIRGDGDFTIAGPIRAINDAVRRDGTLSKEDAEYASGVITGDIKDNEDQVREHFSDGKETQKRKAIEAVYNISENGVDVLFLNISEDEWRTVQQRMEGYANFRLK
jgi:hypothetical protein